MDKHTEIMRNATDAMSEHIGGIIAAYLAENGVMVGSSPCDLCRYNPPSSGDVKPCSMCPAAAKGRIKNDR